MIFPPPLNRLERTITDNSLWQLGCYFYPTYLSKHSAKEAYQHRFTIPRPDAESPIFKTIEPIQDTFDIDYDSD